MEEKEEKRQRVLAFVSLSPAYLSHVMIRDYNNVEINIREYDCPAKDVGYCMSLDSDEFDYEKVMLIGGPKVFVEKIQEQIASYFPDTKVFM